MSPPAETPDICIRVALDGRAFLVRYAGIRPASIAQENPFGGEMWRLPVDQAPPGWPARKALAAAEAFVASQRLPAVAS
jgi:hypothetical protein